MLQGWWIDWHNLYLHMGEAIRPRRTISHQSRITDLFVLWSQCPFCQAFSPSEPGCAVAGATLLPKSLRRSPGRPQPLEQLRAQFSSTAPTLSTVNMHPGAPESRQAQTVEVHQSRLSLVQIDLFEEFKVELMYLCRHWNLLTFGLKSPKSLPHYHFCDNLLQSCHLFDIWEVLLDHIYQNLNQYIYWTMMWTRRC